MNNWIIFVSMGLFWVWEQRNGRWTKFLQAISGKQLLPNP
jgi:hypothetical protein